MAQVANPDYGWLTYGSIIINFISWYSSHTSSMLIGITVIINVFELSIVERKFDEPFKKAKVTVWKIMIMIAYSLYQPDMTTDNILHSVPCL